MKSEHITFYFKHGNSNTVYTFSIQVTETLDNLYVPPSDIDRALWDFP